MLEQGQTNAALEKMRQSVEMAGESWDLALPFALELAKRGDQESLAICDRVLAQKPVQQAEYLFKAAIQTKVDCQSFLGDFVGALETHKQLCRQSVDREELENNNLAYRRALAGVELGQAFGNIEQAIQQNASDWMCGQRLEFRDKAIVAAALLARYFLYEAAVDSRIESQEVAKMRLQTTLTYLNSSIDKIEIQFGSIINCETGDHSQVNLQRCAARSNLVVLLIVRSMVLLDVGDKAASNRDRFRANQMSKDLDNVIQNLPDERSCMHLLSAASAFLDTRGLIKSKLDWIKMGETNVARLVSSYRDALQDLDLAILACQFDRRALQGSLNNQIDLTVERVESYAKLLFRTEAVLLYHRMLTHQRAGEDQAANADRLAIERLGFAVNSQLF